MKRPKLKLRWPFETAITISLIALVVSALQLILSTPMLMELYFKPLLVVIDSSSSAPDVAGFEVRNEGRRAAKSVELAIICGENDTVMVMPDLGATVSHNSSVWVRTFRIVVPYLSPGETFAVLVRKGPNSPPSVLGQISKQPTASIQSGRLPAVVYLRSEAGLGDIRATKLDFKFVSTTSPQP